MMETTATNEVLFYTGTYASADQPGIFLCALNKDTGEMRIVNHMDGVDNPSYLALCPDGTCLYVASETDEALPKGLDAAVRAVFAAEGVDEPNAPGDVKRAVRDCLKANLPAA